jgi:endogenous inhibitor of DNA gyrase (YacG/DUF329 family)
MANEMPLARPADSGYIIAMTDETPSAAPACPICGRPRVQQFRPFCSKRCADVDLNRWLKGVYAVPVTETDDEDGDKAPDDPAAPSGR